LTPGGNAKPPPAPVVRYGDHPDQVANLHLPAREGGPWAGVVLVHGGFWGERWDRTLMTPLAIDLARRGYAAWNVEFRRVGQDGGGWPGTLEDVDNAVDALGDVPEVDPERVVAVGHSAGGHLALWLAARRSARVRLRAAISLAGVVDLERAHRDGLGDAAIARFLGGDPEEVPDRYAAASPASLLPLGVPHLLVHGARDEIVPVTLSRSYAEAARAAGDDAELVELPGADHFDVIDPQHEAWAVVVEDWLG
jgi:acetyl esterase/lipase